MNETKYRLIFEWPRYEKALREAAAGRRWSDPQIEAALQRDRICTIEVGDLDAHLDWHERLGFDPPVFRPAEG